MPNTVAIEKLTALLKRQERERDEEERTKLRDLRGFVRGIHREAGLRRPAISRRDFK